MILLFFPIYIIIGFVKEFTLQKFFYITPYLIIYTPLETPGSSPTGCFSMQRTGRRNDLIIVVPAACFLSIDGVHMHHAVLYVFEFIFDGMMHIFRCVSLEAANVQLAKNHEGYSREAEGYKAYAVSYMLCQRYGVDVKGYDISRLDGVLQGQDPREEVPAALTDMRDTFKEMNGRMARAMGLTRTSRQKEQER